MSSSSRVRIEVIGSESDVTTFWDVFSKLLHNDASWGNKHNRAQNVNWFLRQVANNKFSEDVCNFDSNAALCDASKAIDGYVLVTVTGDHYSQSIYCAGVGMNAEYKRLRVMPNIQVAREVADNIRREKAAEEMDAKRRKLQEQIDRAECERIKAETELKAMLQPIAIETNTTMVLN